MGDASDDRTLIDRAIASTDEADRLIAETQATLDRTKALLLELAAKTKAGSSVAASNSPSKRADAPAPVTATLEDLDDSITPH